VAAVSGRDAWAVGLTSDRNRYSLIEH